MYVLFLSLVLNTWRHESWLSRAVFKTYPVLEQFLLTHIINTFVLLPFGTNSIGLLCSVICSWVTLVLFFLPAFHPPVGLLGVSLLTVSPLLYQPFQLTATASLPEPHPPKITQLASLQFTLSSTRISP